MKEIHGKDDVVPGEQTTFKEKTLCAGSALIGKFDPINQICNHIIGFHFYSGEMNRQLVAHHFCSVINQDMRQCLIYDTDKADAKLIGVEYIISANLFSTLPEEEKKFWHSHVHEVKSGMLSCTRLPFSLENEEMKWIVNTYGKTFHFWQIDRGDKLPMGEPKLMMAFTHDGQADPVLIKKRDDIYGISTPENKIQRESIPVPVILPGADNWKNGKAIILEVKEIDFEPDI